MGVLRLYREPVAWMDRLRAYTLVIDDEPSGQIGNGETLEVELAPGHHRVRMQIDWCRSSEIAVDGSGDVALRCRPNANPFFALLYITLWTGDYIRLERG